MCRKRQCHTVLKSLRPFLPMQHSTRHTLMHTPSWHIISQTLHAPSPHVTPNDALPMLRACATPAVPTHADAATGALQIAAGPPHMLFSPTNHQTTPPHACRRQQEAPHACKRQHEGTARQAAGTLHKVCMLADVVGACRPIAGVRPPQKYINLG
jgi:hypothetical protein